MKLSIIYIAIQIAIIVGLAITSPGIFLAMIALGVVIYGGFILFCIHVVGPRPTPDDQPKP